MIYGIWADIFINHEYFGGKCGCFSFLPDPPTTVTMRREGIQMRETVGGFRLIAQESAFSENSSLLFWGYPLYHELWNVTDFSDIPADTIPLAKVKGDTVKWESASKDAVPEAMQFPKPMFGIELENSPGKPGINATLSLKTRKMKWCYYISGISEDDAVEIVKIKAGSDSSPFDFSKRHLGDSIFISKQEIPLRYNTPPLFQLREKKSSKPIIKCLPNMDARSVSTIENNDKREFVAESFVNT